MLSSYESSRSLSHLLMSSCNYFWSHTARDTLRYLQRNNVAFIEPDMWPPNSPDLNPVDYAVWGALQHWSTNIEASRLLLNWSRQLLFASAWQQLSQAFIDKSINKWRCRLECVVQQNGGHIEHLFKNLTWSTVTFWNFQTDVNGSIVNTFYLVLASIRWKFSVFSQGTVATLYMGSG